MATQRDLSLAYSPGVAVPVKAIAKDPGLAYDYTSKGNMVAVISNGTAILGLGDLGALAAKPVMEGKSVLFKRFADIDSVDIEVDTKDPEEFIDCVKYLGPAFGGINLEDIAAPDSFYIEQRLKELMDIPVFHDDQHGTAIIAAAGLLNALDITGKSIREIKVAVSGAGSSALSVIGLIKAMGLPHENALVCDSKGVLRKERDLDQWRSAHAVETDKRTLAQAVDGADVLIGLSVAGAVSKEMIASMAKNPVVFVMANPVPEILPEDIRAVRSDAIVATGRSDYPNQVNNVLGFPYIFRGALDARARTINEEMKIACAKALAALAREDVPDEVAAAYGKRLKYGPGYIIPTPFDPRLISTIPPAVARAASDSGAARKPIADLAAYSAALAARTDPSASFLQTIYATLRARSKRRIVFAEGEEPAVLRAAYVFQQEGLGTPVLVGREEVMQRALEETGLPPDARFETHHSRSSPRADEYTDYLYRRLQRRGYLYRDAQRLVSQDRNVFSACMLAHGDADGMVTGVTRNYDVALENVRLALDARADRRPIGMSIILAKGRTIFVADTTITGLPTSQDLAEIAVQAAGAARRLGAAPKVAFVSYSNFGNPDTEHSRRVSGAVKLLDSLPGLDFEYEGEMTPRMALNERYRAVYPFSRLKGEANVLVTPGAHSASISTSLVGELAGATVIGPVLIGLEGSVQIAQVGARVADIVALAALAAYDLDAGGSI
jgi:malate dehydrogenase (oxaloacetate-decarboxylating)(NADP+)